MYGRKFGWGDSLLKCNKGFQRCAKSVIAKACLTVKEISWAGTKVGYSEQQLLNGKDCDKKRSYDRDNRVVAGKSSYRPSRSLPRCWLWVSLGCISSKGLDCSSINNPTWIEFKTSRDSLAYIYYDKETILIRIFVRKDQIVNSSDVSAVEKTRHRPKACG